MNKRIKKKKQKQFNDRANHAIKEFCENLMIRTFDFYSKIKESVKITPLKNE